jgi:hypothetical protein
MKPIEYKKSRLKQVKIKAKELGLICLSKEFKTVNTKMKFKCKIHGICYKSHKSVCLKNAGCAKCGYIRTSKALSYSIEDIKKIVEDRGGRLITKKYKNLSTKINYICDKGHERIVVACSLIQGHWCKKCSDNANAKKLLSTIEDMQKVASMRGFKCLSKEYKISNEKLEWECQFGHSFMKTPSNLKFGQGCPTCSSSVGENVVREYFENSFLKKFPKARKLEWLKSKEGNYLELDGYCEELKIAFEHQGEHHYKTLKHHRDEYKTIQKRDSYKAKLCAENNVKLICVPDVSNMIGFNNLKSWLSNEFKKTINIKYIDPIQVQIDYKKVFSNRQHEMKKALEDVVKNNGGRLINIENHTNQYSKANVECKNGHIIRKRVSCFIHKKNRPFCPKCNHENKRNIRVDKLKQRVDEVVKIKKGKLIEFKDIKASSDRIKVRCLCGNEWSPTINKLLHRGSWCRKCGYKRIKY